MLPTWGRYLVDISASLEVLCVCFKLCFDHCIPHPFQLIIHHSSVIEFCIVTVTEGSPKETMNEYNFVRFWVFLMVMMEDIRHVKWFMGTWFQRACCHDLECSTVRVTLKGMAVVFLIILQ